MEIVVTAVGPDNVGLADPIIHELTAQGASIAEIQMYDHDEAAVFAMIRWNRCLTRIRLQQTIRIFSFQQSSRFYGI